MDFRGWEKIGNVTRIREGVAIHCRGKLGIFKDIPVVSRGCTKRIQFDGITITGVMSENNEISLNHRDPLRIHPSAFHHAPPPPLFLPPRTREKREHVPPNQFRYSAHYRATSGTKQRLNQPARPRSILPSRILFFRKPRNTRIYMYICTNRGSLSRCYIIIEDLERSK